MNKITVLYHRADFDGLFCREIAKKFLPDAELIGWDYGDKLIPFPSEGEVYVLDLSPDCFESLPKYQERLIWIDHHKSAIEKYPTTIPGYRIDGVSACRLAWQWFACWVANGKGMRGPWHEVLPPKERFVDRTVSEPFAVQLAGEYDIWDKRNPEAEVFQLGLRSVDQLAWDWLLSFTGMPYIEKLLERGKILQRYQRAQDTFAMNNSFIVEFEGLKFLALNTQAKSSLAFASKDVPETGHDALLKFSFNGKIWDCSMYHAKHNTGIDLSQIAVKHGGGGHSGACGFRSATLPFNQP